MMLLLKKILKLKDYEINTLAYENQIISIFGFCFAIGGGILNYFFLTIFYEFEPIQVVWWSIIYGTFGCSFYLSSQIKNEKHKFEFISFLTVILVVFLVLTYYPIIGPTVWTYFFSIMVVSFLREGLTILRLLAVELLFLGIYVYTLPDSYILDYRYYLAQFVAFAVLSVVAVFVYTNNHKKNVFITSIINELRESENKFRKMIETLPDKVFKLNQDGIIIDSGVGDTTDLYDEKSVGVNQSFIQNLPLDLQEHCHQLLTDTLRNDNSNILEFEFITSKGTAYFEGRFGKVDTNEALLIIRDISAIKEQQKHIEYLSYHDQLTGLYNRRFFEEELKRLNRARNLPLSLIMLDVNGLKLTNDAFGHRDGDALLKKLSDVLKQECREDEIIARIGGDEFILILPKTAYTYAENLSNRIYKAVSNEHLNGLPISVSMGVETKTLEDESIDEILIKAEEHMYRKKLLQSQSMRNQTIQAISQTLNQKSRREKLHSEKVSALCRQFGIALGLDDERTRELEIAGLMHDIGKISVDESILNKPARLTDYEYMEMQKHPESGYQILKSTDAYSTLAEHVLSHHERWDGNGYPRKLKGEEISMVARIISVVDAFEAMTSDRPYRMGISVENAIEEIKKNMGTQFDPNIAMQFIHMLEVKL